MLFKTLFVALLVLVIGVLSAPTNSASTVTLHRRAGSWVDQMVCLINKERTRVGLPKLAIDDTLNKIAQKHADYMYSTKTMTHSDPEGSLGTRLAKAGIKWTGCSENVAGGMTNVNSAFDAWMKSSGHYANIVSKNSNIFGAGHTDKYFVNDFAAVSVVSENAYIPVC
ncbi:hypothetical protein H4219_004287 [Mycoemilia scoparia]|uniref:SCP domain-containing protein n=1 Tax=Mycoemilia scoparia TaxID=417184 RepID=A0A9W7ZXV9_9FUNG|nr:hypothetical protein H4219_004287 [Mycoemilia scoparia]